LEEVEIKAPKDNISMEENGSEEDLDLINYKIMIVVTHLEDILHKVQMANPGMMVHAYNSSTWETEAEGL
jgi:hypothetical protein